MGLPFWLVAIVVGFNLLLLPYLGLILLTALAVPLLPPGLRKPDAPRTRFLVVIRHMTRNQELPRRSEAAFRSGIPRAFSRCW